MFFYFFFRCKCSPLSGEDPEADPRFQSGDKFPPLLPGSAAVLLPGEPPNPEPKPQRPQNPAQSFHTFFSFFIEKRPQTAAHLQKATEAARQKLSAELLLGREGKKKVKFVLFQASPENCVSHTSLKPSRELPNK